MRIYSKLYLLIFALIVFALGCPNPALSAKGDNIPEKYKVETLMAMYEKSDLSAIFERCSEGIKDKAVPDKYKSVLYTIRARTYLHNQEAVNKENGIKAGLDCIRSNHLDPENFSCVEVLQSYISTTFLMSHQAKDEKLDEKVLAEFEKKHQKIKSDFLAELEKTARSEKIEGVDQFFKHLPEYF